MLCFLNVCLYQINVKTAEPIELNIFKPNHITPEKVYDFSKINKFFLEKIVKFIIHENAPISAEKSGKILRIKNGVFRI